MPRCTRPVSQGGRGGWGNTVKQQGKRLPAKNIPPREAVGAGFGHRPWRGSRVCLCVCALQLSSFSSLQLWKASVQLWKTSVQLWKTSVGGPELRKPFVAGLGEAAVRVCVCARCSCLPLAQCSCGRLRSQASARQQCARVLSSLSQLSAVAVGFGYRPGRGVKRQRG